MKTTTTNSTKLIAMKTLFIALMLLTGNIMFGQVNAQNSMLSENVPSTANLDKFTATYDNQSGIVKLNWVLTTQEEQAKLIVEKSADGVNYSYLGKVPAIASTNKITYSCRDNNPAQGSNFYRLKAVTASNDEFIYDETAHVSTNQPVDLSRPIAPVAEGSKTQE